MDLRVTRHQGLSLQLTFIFAEQHFCITEVPANNLLSRAQTARFAQLIRLVKPFTSHSINVADMLRLKMFCLDRHI